MRERPRPNAAVRLLQSMIALVLPSRQPDWQSTTTEIDAAETPEWPEYRARPGVLTRLGIGKKETGPELVPASGDASGHVDDFFTAFEFEDTPQSQSSPGEPSVGRPSAPVSVAPPRAASRPPGPPAPHSPPQAPFPPRSPTPPRAPPATEGGAPSSQRESASRSPQSTAHVQSRGAWPSAAGLNDVPGRHRGAPAMDFDSDTIENPFDEMKWD